jgi:hypothetical protein
MTFDLPSFFNIVLSGLIGVITSWFITHWYYLKNSPTERMLKELRKALPNYLLPVVEPQFYRSDSERLLPFPAPPEDPDIPHAEYAILSDRNPAPNVPLQVLFKIRDLGFDLENPSGVQVCDHLQRQLSVQRIGLGYITVQFITTPLPCSGQYALTITLSDQGGRINTQSVRFYVVEG